MRECQKMWVPFFGQHTLYCSSTIREQAKFFCFRKDNMIEKFEVCRHTILALGYPHSFKMFNLLLLGIKSSINFALVLH